MPTPKAWSDAAKLALERENAPKVPRNRPESPDTAYVPEIGTVHEDMSDLAVWVGKFEVVDK
jgi:hypothetical protein